MEQVDAGERLDRLLVRLCGQSRNSVSRMIAEGNVQLDGKTPSKAGVKVKAGQRLVWRKPEMTNCEVLPEDIPLDVVHEDADLIVVNKPAGMVVHPAAGNPSGTLVNALLAHCGDFQGIGGVLRPGIVHRIDKDTSGLLVVAKNDQSHQALSDQFRDHSTQRSYQAFVFGRPKVEDGTIETMIARHRTDRKKFAVSQSRGKHAVTHYSVLAVYDEISRLELRLETGRTHQIRVHLSHIGFPIVADKQYCNPRRVAHIKKKTLQDRLKGIKRQLLHAASLGFVHPGNGQEMFFEAPLPDDMAELLRWLEE